jgi:hypothetical protein
MVVDQDLSEGRREYSSGRRDIKNIEQKRKMNIYIAQAIICFRPESKKKKTINRPSDKIDRRAIKKRKIKKER